MSSRLSKKGFTIIELMIATVVFSVILLIATMALLQVGRIYNRGVVNSKTQEVARTIVEDISQSIQFNGGQVNTIAANGSTTGYCVGQRRYSVLRGQMLADDNTKHALVADKITGACSSGLTALDLTQPNPPGANSPQEFLSPFMRVANFTITAEGNNLYRISVRVVHGDDGLLINPSGTNASCAGGKGTQFCSVSELTTVVQKRVL